MEAFDAPGLYAPAELPPEFVEGALAARPVRIAGTQPTAAVILLEIQIQNAEAA